MTMKKSLSGLLVLVLMAGSFVADAQRKPSPVGSWVGKTQIANDKVPMARTPEAKKRQDEALRRMAATTFRLIIRPNETVTMERRSPDSAKPVRLDGKWTMVGDQIQITMTKRDGKELPADQKRQETITWNSKANTLKAIYRDTPWLTINFTPQK